MTDRGTEAPGHRGTEGVLHVSVVSPERVLFDAEATAAIVPAYDGLVGILPRHAPMLVLLGRGTLTIRTGGGDQRFTVGGGFAQVRANTIRVVAEEATVLGPEASAA